MGAFSNQFVGKIFSLVSLLFDFPHPIVARETIGSSEKERKNEATLAFITNFVAALLLMTLHHFFYGDIKRKEIESTN